jgi:drug/metabolite transporter (DMT)-like permease
VDGSALNLVLTAAFCHAAWNLVAKRAGGGNAFVLLSSVLVSLLWAPLALWVGLTQALSLGWLEWGVLLATAVVHALYFRSLLYGYQVADLTVVYPTARGGGPLLSTLGAVLLLGEVLHPLAALGALAVVGGVFLIGGGVNALRGTTNAQHKARTRRGLLWGGITAVCIASYTVIDAYAVKVLLIAPVLVDYFGNLLRIPLMLPFVWRDGAGVRRVWETHRRALIVVAVLGPLSYILVLYAMSLAPLSRVAPAREVSTLLAALLGGSLLREGDRMWRVAGAVLVAGGVVGLAGA